MEILFDPVELFAGRFPDIMDQIFNLVKPVSPAATCYPNPEHSILVHPLQDDLARFKVSKSWNEFLTNRQKKGKEPNKDQQIWFSKVYSHAKKVAVNEKYCNRTCYIKHIKYTFDQNYQDGHCPWTYTIWKEIGKSAVRQGRLKPPSWRGYACTNGDCNWRTNLPIGPTYLAPVIAEHQYSMPKQEQCIANINCLHRNIDRVLKEFNLLVNDRPVR